MEEILVGLVENDFKEENLIKIRFLFFSEKLKKAYEATNVIYNFAKKNSLNVGYEDGLVIFEKEDFQSFKRFKFFRLNTFTKDEVEKLLKCESVYDESINTNVFEYMQKREICKKNRELIKKKQRDIKFCEAILNRDTNEYERYINDETFREDIINRLIVEKKLLDDLLNK